DGSIDWLCLPRFDSDACFAALLGGPEHGRWLIAPRGAGGEGGEGGEGDSEVRRVTRRYLPDTPLLETSFETDGGQVSVIDFMPLGDGPGDLEGRTGEVIRLVQGLEGRVEMHMDFVLRFGYGRTVPWVRRRDYGLRAVAGPDAIELVTPVELHG